MDSKKYQIFISSTYSDLIEERDGIIKSILEMYHIPIGMEMFSAEDEDQWEIIRRTISVSDYYILILGLRYGSKMPDGISFTQKEYEYALEQKIPILAFILHDSAPLTKEKRDDNLMEINTFRSLVLKNSKMSQFWSTKNELLKSVSISLMKQMMQKPGTGWVRGDQIGSSEALSAEIAALSKENRELRDTIIDLKAQISPRKPKIEIELGSIYIDENYKIFKPIKNPTPLTLDNIPEQLREFVSQEELNGYNKRIPSQEIIDKYNEEIERFHKLANYSSPILIRVCNSGTIKATNIYVDIKFPSSLVIFKKDATFKKPKNPLPISPIEIAKEKYLEKNKPKYTSTFPLLGRLSGLDVASAGIPFRTPPLPNINAISRTSWTNIDEEENEITIRIDNLIHTRCKSFDDEYMIAPLRDGIHEISFSVICEEMSDVANGIFTVQIQNSNNPV